MFDEAETSEGSELYRARAAVATMLKCIAHDISRIPKTDPSRAGNSILDMQIDDIAEVVEKYLQGSSRLLSPRMSSVPPATSLS